jgi:hypothetical protein
MVSPSSRPIIVNEDREWINRDFYPAGYHLDDIQNQTLELQDPTRGLNVLYIYINEYNINLYTWRFVYNMYIFMFKHFGGGVACLQPLCSLSLIQQQRLSSSNQ